MFKFLKNIMNNVTISRKHNLSFVDWYILLFIISLFGAIGFLISGSFLKANLPLSIGFINIPAFLIFVPITTFMARVGANSVNKIDKSKVQSLFGVFLYVVGTIFIYRYLSL